LCRVLGGLWCLCRPWVPLERRPFSSRPIFCPFVSPFTTSVFRGASPLLSQIVYHTCAYVKRSLAYVDREDAKSGSSGDKNQAKPCHSERSEESAGGRKHQGYRCRYPYSILRRMILRSAQNDRS